MLNVVKHLFADMHVCDRKVRYRFFAIAQDDKSV